MDNASRNGRPTKLNPRDTRGLFRISKEQRKATLNETHEESQLNVSEKHSKKAAGTRDLIKDCVTCQVTRELGNCGVIL